MASSDRERLRATFEEDAAAYDAARPVYPDELIDDLLALDGLREGARVLEIGCGTGQATLPIARRGYSITSVRSRPRRFPRHRRHPPRPSRGG